MKSPSDGRRSPPVFAHLAWVFPALLASCVSASYKVKPHELPLDLDSHLAARERSVPGLIPGNEREIVWAGERGAKTPLSIVYIHGWQGCSHDYEAVFRRVAAELGANVYYARLRGYGVTTDEIAQVTLNDWVNETAEAFEVGRRMGERVVVAGSSMGGDLALWLATRHQPELAALVLFSCAVQPRDGRSELLLWPWPVPQIMLGTAIGRYTNLTFEKETYPTGSPELYAKLYPARYHSDSYLRLMASVKMVRMLPLENITVPSLWLYSDKDMAVDIPVLKKYFARTGGTGKRLVHVASARGHMLAGDVFCPEANGEVSGDILSFLQGAGLAP